MSKTVLGFVGLGNMGAPMASRLIDAGYELVIYDRSEAALQALVAKGARAAASPAAVASEAETVLISLPTPDVVKLVCTGADGLSSGTKIRRIVDLSTTGPQAEADVATRLQGTDIKLIDCPVSGGVAGASKGSLALMASGDRDAFDLLVPVLENLGKVFYVGAEPGMAQTMKLINNICSAAALAITSEAMVLGAKAGLEAETMIDVLNAGSGRNSASVDKIPRFVLPRTFDFGFAVGLSAKDIRLCVEEGERLGVPMMVASAVRQLFSITRSEFGHDADMTAVIRTVEQWAGAEVKGKDAKA
ncbi:oxidoreductase [Metarhizobium album]|uniref:Oxidoreductase n=1 Tax=Metarhizobium album TaxID=2182425 RepID=A0A2U2DR91_9HYPH|nr:NAD(P)-dependent oxidoreductase [Rhizobium album]PWE55835.1 oxidoreductase [Rhizobium album]